MGKSEWVARITTLKNDATYMRGESEMIMSRNGLTGLPAIAIAFAALSAVIMLLAPHYAGAQQGSPAKNFTLEDINSWSPTYGEQLTLSEDEGAILVLLFFTPQQSQAEQEEILASLTNGLWATYETARCFRFFAIGGFAEESRDEILAMRPDLPNATFPILYDPDKAAWGTSVGDLYRALGDSNVPLAVVIDHDFKIYNWKFGVADYQNYNQQLVTWVLELDPYVGCGPLLSDPTHTPDSGRSDTDFTFTVDYYSDEGYAPGSIEVAVNETAHDMTLASGNASDGTYSWTGTIPEEGTAQYHFGCSDGKVSCFQHGAAAQQRGRPGHHVYIGDALRQCFCQ